MSELSKNDFPVLYGPAIDRIDIGEVNERR